MQSIGIELKAGGEKMEVKEIELTVKKKSETKIEKKDIEKEVYTLTLGDEDDTIKVILKTTEEVGGYNINDRVKIIFENLQTRL
jgi:hypothetical protein